MKRLKKYLEKMKRGRSQKNAQQKERGSAIAIVSLVLALLTVYVSTALTVSTTDAVASNFEAAQRRAFYSAYSKLEQMTADFGGLFAASLSPSYDSMCQVVLKNLPSQVLYDGSFRLLLPNASCGGSGTCSASYSGKYLDGTNIYDLGWVNSNHSFCMVDVCNPGAAPVCSFPPRPNTTTQITKGEYAGLQGFVRRYRMSAAAASTNRGGADIQITRDFDNILLPLFQFGIFTDSDFELYDPPRWSFGGWIHTNGDFYVTGNNSGFNPPDRTAFSRFIINSSGELERSDAKITVSRHVIVGARKDGSTSTGDVLRVYRASTNINDTTLVLSINTGGGSAVQGSNLSNCNGVAQAEPDSGTSLCGPFSGNALVRVGAPRLRLPIQAALAANPIALIQRGLVGEPQQMIDAKYYYKASIRITLADYQNQLPRTMMPGDNPANPTGPHGGIWLDGPDPWLAQNVGTHPALGPNIITTNCSGGPCWYYQRDDGTTSILLPGQTSGTPQLNRRVPIPRGYQPKIKNTTSGRPTGARVNGNRIHGWLKVELLRFNAAGSLVRTYDITEEFANLGLTVPYKGNNTTAFYYPRSTPGFPAQIPVPANSTGPFPDENSVIHLQRFAVPYSDVRNPASLPALPTSLSLGTPAGAGDATLRPALDEITGIPGFFDYYSSMSLRGYNDNSIRMFGIVDDQHNVPAPIPSGFIGYMSRFAGGPTPAAVELYSEPQYDSGGYYTHAPGNPILGNPIALPQTLTSSHALQIDYSAPATTPSTSRQPGPTDGLAENINLPKSRTSTLTDPFNAVLSLRGESTWYFCADATCNNPLSDRRLIPFPINIYDPREGLPHEAPFNAFPSDPPVPGLNTTAVNKNGVMNLVEIDMGNLGRLLRGDFNNLFAQMGDTAYRIATGNSLTAADIRDNIDIRQDNGWVIYISDRRGDDPVLQNKYTAIGAGMPAGVAASITAGTPSHIGNGEYHRENVVWNPGGNISSGNEAFIPPTGSCTPDGLDRGKSPQDSNNNCIIEREGPGNWSETAPVNASFTADQATGWTGFGAPLAGQVRYGNMIAMTQVPSVDRPSWSVRPPLNQSATPPKVEIFRRAVRLVNAANLFPTGPVIRTTGCIGSPLGVTIATENPVYVFGNYNAPAGAGVDMDAFPGLAVNASTSGLPTPTTQFNGNNLATCGTNCHVPAAIVADAVSLLSNPFVGTANANWTNFAGWLDSRSFVTPYQAIGLRPARHTVYRFAMVAGFTPSWNPNFWGNHNTHQGTSPAYSSGALNNFPRFLEDWAQNGAAAQACVYAGSLIRMYKSRQANGAFKRNSSSSTHPHLDYVYRPPNRDWSFDLDFNVPCLLPPGSPFLQMIDFKSFHQGAIQRP